MRKRIATMTIVAALLAVLAGAAPAAAAPELEVSSTHEPASPTVGAGAIYKLTVSNASATDPTSGNVTVQLTVPTGIEVVSMSSRTFAGFFGSYQAWSCSTPDTQTASCTGTSGEFGPVAIGAGEQACVGPLGSACPIMIVVKIAEGVAPGTIEPAIHASGGGSAAFDGVAPTVIGPAVEFGLHDVSMSLTDPEGSTSTQAGAHPFNQRTSFRVNSVFDVGAGRTFPVEDIRDILFELPAGFVGDPLAVPRCPIADFLTFVELPVRPNCPDATAIGEGTIIASGENVPWGVPIYNLEPAPGQAARFGFSVLDTQVPIEAEVSESAPYSIVAGVRNAAQRGAVFGSEVSLWGVAADARHDKLRGRCKHVGSGTCPSTATIRPFLTQPRSCTGPYETTVRARSWHGSVYEETVQSPGGTGCSKLGLPEPEISSEASTRSAESPSGLAFELTFNDEGLLNPSDEAVAGSDIKTAKVTLPEGVTINPSQAIGLQTCSPAQFARERSNSAPGAGCPEASKVGTTEVETPLLEGELLKGSVYVAQQDDPATSAPGAENPFDSLIALYMTVKSERRGINVRLAGKVEPDPVTGQIVTTFGDGSSLDPEFAELPQLPFSNFRVRLREGGRSPLVTPPTCGSFQTQAELTPWANPGRPVTVTAMTQITSGVGGGPCPTGGQPFEPGFEAGTANNNGGSFSPFNMRLTRRDGDQDLVRFDATLPPGVLAKLAGVSRCSDAQIAQIAQKTGKQELANPSCPANSRIGGVQGGAGVGSQLVYVPGSVYLAGPFDGAPISVVGVVPAVAGPFDVGVVVTRQALVVDPKTGIVTADGEKSDPIPHILAGIPLRVRDIQVNVNRPEFTLNPTSCDPYATDASIWGGGQDVFSLHDDSPVGRAARFQAANCSRLGFKPRLTLRLKGGTRRGVNPALQAVLRPRPGDANIERTVVRLPRSAFLDQAHIRTICTRVQFAADNCPKGSIYGRVVAHTPLLEEPLRGPAYLRSSNNELPDLVFDLKGLVDIESSARIDSIRGGIRAIFAGIPDAPLSKVVVRMQGGRKGLIVNSRNLCAAKSRANVTFDGHNGKRRKINPLVRPQCGKRRNAKRSSHGRAGGVAHSTALR